MAAETGPGGGPCAAGAVWAARSAPHPTARHTARSAQPAQGLAHLMRLDLDGRRFSRSPARTCAGPASPRRRRHASSIGRAASPSGGRSSCAESASAGARWCSGAHASCRRTGRCATARARVSVALSMASRAREYSYHLARDGRSMGLSFHCRSGSSMRALNRRSCSLLPTSSQNLMRMMPRVDDVLLDHRAQLEKPFVLLLGAEPHHVLDAGAVVPAAVEDHDLAGRREVRHVALHVHLALLAVRRRRQRHEAEDARADALGDRLDRAALAGGVAPLEDRR